MSNSSAFHLPEPLLKLFSAFPLKTYPDIENPYVVKVAKPTLWIHPPLDPKSGHFSRDVECLKWQAYFALRGLKNVEARWDVSPEAGLDGTLPTLQTPEGRLLNAEKMVGWVEDTLDAEESNGELEGYVDADVRDESRAWVTLLETVVHAQLVRRLCPMAIRLLTWETLSRRS